MKFLFLDESDKQENGKRKFFLISGLFVDSSNLLILNKTLEEYRVANGFKNLKDLRKNKKIFQEEKLKETKNIFQILEKFEVKVLTAILGETTMSTISDFESAYNGALNFLVERFCLQIRPDMGMIFFDKMAGPIQKNIEQKFYETIQKDQLVMFGDKLGDYSDFIYPAISFISDEYSAILQVSDLISTSFNFAIANSLMKNDAIFIGDLKNLSPYLKIYWPLVVKSKQGKHNGWGVKLWD